MKKFLSIFTRNWWLKLLALALALAVFYGVRGSFRTYTFAKPNIFIGADTHANDR